MQKKKFFNVWAKNSPFIIKGVFRLRAGYNGTHMVSIILLGGGEILDQPHRLVPTKIFDFPAPLVTTLLTENK